MNRHRLARRFWARIAAWANEKARRAMVREATRLRRGRPMTWRITLARIASRLHDTARKGDALTEGQIRARIARARADLEALEATL